MTSQFGQELIAPSPALALWTGTAATKPLLWVPHNVRYNGKICCSSAGAQVPSPLFVRVPQYSAMAAADAGAARLFAAARGKFPEILDVQNGGPRPVTLGKLPSMTVASETFDVTV